MLILIVLLIFGGIATLIVCERVISKNVTVKIGVIGDNSVTQYTIESVLQNYGVVVYDLDVWYETISDVLVPMYSFYVDVVHVPLVEEIIFFHMGLYPGFDVCDATAQKLSGESQDLFIEVGHLDYTKNDTISPTIGGIGRSLFRNWSM